MQQANLWSQSSRSLGRTASLTLSYVEKYLQTKPGSCHKEITFQCTEQGIAFIRDYLFLSLSIYFLLIIRNCAGPLLTGPLDTNFNEMLTEIQTFSLKNAFKNVVYKTWSQHDRHHHSIKNLNLNWVLTSKPVLPATAVCYRQCASILNSWNKL